MTPKPILPRVEQIELLRAYPALLLVRLRGNTEYLMLAYRP